VPPCSGSYAAGEKAALTARLAKLKDAGTDELREKAELQEALIRWVGGRSCLLHSHNMISQAQQRVCIPVRSGMTVHAVVAYFPRLCHLWCCMAPWHACACLYSINFE